MGHGSLRARVSHEADDRGKGRMRFGLADSERRLVVRLSAVEQGLS